MRQKYGAGVAAPYYGELEYGVHLCAGLIPWILFSDVLMRSASVLIDNSNFLQKVSFPPTILFASVFFNSLLINGTGYLCFLGILVLLGKAPPLVALAGLGVMFLMGVLAMGLGLILAGLNVFFRDTLQVITVAMQFLFWFNPIVYPRERFLNPDLTAGPITVFEQLGAALLRLNPFERFITATQWLMGNGIVKSAPTALDWLIVLGLPVLCLGAGLALFRRMLPDIRDCL
jgi:lipopolysaccharide transport system permease protein